MSIGKRTGFDFHKHRLETIKDKHVLIHKLKIPGRKLYEVVFINCQGVLSVTGDWGNWIFCREFHPSDHGYVSDSYWLEKLGISSTQKGEVFDSNQTREEIEEGINGGLAEYGYKGDDLKEVISYYKDLLDYVEDEQEYYHFAYNDKPDFIDPDDVPLVKNTTHYLNYVFDAFEEICRRMKNEN